MAENLVHSKWVCKYRRKIVYNQLRADIQQHIRVLCKWKGVEILEGHMTSDHVHLLLSIPPKYCVFSFMRYLKGKSAMMLFKKHENLKYKCGNWILREYRWTERGNHQEIYPRAGKTGYSLVVNPLRLSYALLGILSWHPFYGWS